MQSVYDIIFLGGGTSACVTAGRLAAADPSLKILILEAGKHTLNVPEHIQPALCTSHLKPGSTTITNHISQPNKQLDGRSITVQCGRAVGGGSAVNFMMYARASASDYDDWEFVHGNTGWSYNHLEKLFQKTETYEPQIGLATHGDTGPLHVSLGPSNNVASSFLNAAMDYDPMRKMVDDANDMHTVDVYTRWPMWTNGKTGHRSDAAHYFIYNQSSNKNLHILDCSLVIRIIIKDGQAIGAEYINADPNLPQEPQIVFASKLVIVSAGTFGTPPILERSGIGAQIILEQHGIDCIVDLPGVGENYLDHNGGISLYKATDDAEVFDASLLDNPIKMAELLSQWQSKGTGLLASNGIHAAVRLRPNLQDLKEIGPSFTARYCEFYERAPDKPALCIVVITSFGIGQYDPSQKKFVLVMYSLYPASAGRIHISDSNPRSPLNFDSGVFSDPSDIAILKWGYKRMREYARRMSIYQGDIEEGHPTFISTNAKVGQEQEHILASAPDIVYQPEDDEALESYIKKSVTASFHSLGTAAMKAKEDRGVVNSRLDVYGIQNLKVADMSIAPSNVSANTYSTALVIGEKAAVIIAEDLGINLRN